MRPISRKVSRTNRVQAKKRFLPRLNKKEAISIVIALFLLALGFWFLSDSSSQTANNQTASGSVANPASPSAKQSPTKKQSFNKKQHSLNDPTSIWVVVNKGRVLPSTYVPADLVVPNVPLRTNSSSSEMHVRAAAAAAMEQMLGVAKTGGINLMLASGYRSYSLQAGLYSSYINTLGKTEADRSSARPGHSEHQTGLAADLEPATRKCEIQQCFDATPEGQWLALNAYKYGFIIRYQKNSEATTGYEYEPWHVRYLGVSLATEIYNSGQTLEKFFGLPLYLDYPAQSYQLGAGL